VTEATDRSVPGSRQKTARSRRSKVLRVVAIFVAVVLVAAVGLFAWWVQPQPLLPEATAALSSTPGATFTDADGRLTYTPTATRPTVGLVLYPGAKVPPAAYAPAARAIAEAGYLVVLVSVPLNLAVLDIGAAQPVIDAHPEIQRWAAGGHSLGGAMSAQFVGDHPGEVRGLVFWAAYSAVDLSSQDLRVANIYGSLDAGVPSYSSPANLTKVGPDVTTTVIEGGNHEQMGWYTGQPNDPPATIPRADQQAQLVAATVALLKTLAG
jgi:alpha/beta hydrolase family protein